MYLDLFGLSKKPFEKTPNTAFFYRSPVHITANAPLMGFSKDLSQIGPDIILHVVEDLDLEPV